MAKDLKAWKVTYILRSIFEATGVILFSIALCAIIFWYAIIGKAQALALTVAGVNIVLSIICFYATAALEERADQLYTQYKILQRSKRRMREYEMGAQETAKEMI